MRSRHECRFVRPLLGALAVGLASASAWAGEEVTNHVNLIIERADDFINPDAEWLVLIDLELPGVADATSVIVTTPDAVAHFLWDEGEDVWEGELDFADFPTMKTALNGLWTIGINGPTPSTSTFALDLSALVDADVFPTPTPINPVADQTNVPADVFITWLDPTGESTADMLFVDIETEDDAGCQEDNSVGGDMTVDDTTWQPPLELLDGWYELALMYLDVDDLGRVGAFTLVEGSIVWGGSPFAPVGYPADRPLFALGAETIIGFEVGTVDACPQDVDDDGSVGFTDLIAILAFWGPCPDCAYDFDTDGFVGFTDLIALLAAWGPCPLP